jgi:hypothetical protein
MRTILNPILLISLLPLGKKIVSTDEASGSR